MIIYYIVKYEDSDYDVELLDRLNAFDDTPSPSRRGLVGRRPGPQPKRKAVEDLSQNANTKKARLRTANFTPAEQKLERLKTNDNAAINYRLRVYRETNKYRDTSKS